MSPIYRLPPQRGLFSRILSAAILLSVVAASLLLGTVLFLVILGAAMLLALILSLRFWWLRRQLAKHPRPNAPGGVTLEGEYTVTKPAKAEGRRDR